MSTGTLTIPARTVVTSDGTIAIASGSLAVTFTASGGVSAPVNTVLPVVTPSSPVVGTAESTTNGTWINSPTSYTYQWNRDSVSISGATASSYTPVSGDVGHTLSCTVTAHNAGGATAATSASTGAVTVSSGAAWSISGTGADMYEPTGGGGWWAYLNPYNGTPINQSISGHNPPYPSGTTISWSWPNSPGPGNVWGYPELLFGHQPWGGGNVAPPNNDGPSPIQVGNLSVLTGTYDITLQGSDLNLYDVLWETHLTTSAGGNAVHEFAIMVHTPQFFRDYLNGYSSGSKSAYTDNGVAGHIYYVNSGYSIWAPDVEPSGTHLTGTFDILGYLHQLVSLGRITNSYYIEGFEMGVEPLQGSGSIVINSISYNWNGSITP